jgi:hypothetical protein
MPKTFVISAKSFGSLALPTLQSDDPVPHRAYPIGEAQPYYRERENAVTSPWVSEKGAITTIR